MKNWQESYDDLFKNNYISKNKFKVRCDNKETTAIILVNLTNKTSLIIRTANNESLIIKNFRDLDLVQHETELLSDDPNLNMQQVRVGYAEYILLFYKIKVDFLKTNYNNFDEFLFGCGIPNRNAYISAIYLNSYMCSYDSEIVQTVHSMKRYVNLLENQWSSRQNVSNVSFNETKVSFKIPLKIHWIWLAKAHNSFCSLTNFQQYMDSWFHRNPNCQFFLWTDYKSIELSIDMSRITINTLVNLEEILPNSPKTLINLVRSHPNVGIRSDILRQLILYEFGGFYCDINDTGCLQSIEPLLQKYSYIVGVEPGLMINNAMIGSVAGHIITGRFLRYLEKALDILNDWYKNPPKDIDITVINQTGPIQFTKIIFGYLLEDTSRFANDIIIFPSKYFYSNFQCSNINHWLSPISIAYHLDHKSFIN